MTAKEKYRNFCQEENSIPLFSQYWWLDAVCGSDNWDVALIENEGEVIASMPYFIKRKYGFKMLTMPHLTPFLGPWIRPSSRTYANELSYQHKLMSGLIYQLPAYDIYRQSWHYTISNWLPFYWRGFNQTVNYTYVIEDIENTERVWNNFHNTVRTDIRKAIKNDIYVRDDGSIGDIIELNATILNNRGIMPFINDVVIRCLDDECKRRSCRKIFIAEDKAGKRHAGLYLVWDKDSAYYLMGGNYPSLPNCGAGSQIIWDGIKFASTVSKRFDFEGSMIPSIERFFRSFGGVQTPVFCISKTDSVLLHAAFRAKDILGAVRDKYDRFKHKTQKAL